MSKRFLTTGEVAAYCGVTIRTTINWIKKGRLRAHQLPGTRGDNRIAPKDLVEFMVQNGLPVPEDLIDGHSDELALTALVVDDDALMARAISRVLRSTGFEVHEAKNGFEAGRLYEKVQPDLMTLDLRMPLLDGFALLEQLQQPRHCKILVVSAETDDKLQRAKSLGADDVLAKPFANKLLVEKIQTVLGTRIGHLDQ